MLHKKMNTGVLENRLFRIGMWWRIFYGILRLFVGFAFLRIIDTPFLDILYKFTSTEIGDNPADSFIKVISSFLQVHPLTVTYFLSAYLIFWGIVDIFLSASLLRHKLWAFPITLWLIALFVLYMLYRFTETHSEILITTIIFDFFIFWLINEEFKKIKNCLTIKKDCSVENKKALL